MLSKKQIEQLAILNSKLSDLEQRIFHLAIQYNQEVEEKLKKGIIDIDEYEIDSNICFCVAGHELVSWNEDMKFALKRFKNQDYWGIADGKDHNTAHENHLRSQKHCWFLHRLYDDFFLNWYKICQIDNIWFDIVIWYQYNLDLKESCLFCDINRINKVLFDFEEKFFELEKQVNIIARNKVLKQEDAIFDYELEEEISFYFDKEKELEALHRNIKFLQLDTKRGKRWRSTHKESWLLSRLQEESGGFGLKEKEIMKIIGVLANVLVRYQYRMHL